MYGPRTYESNPGWANLEGAITAETAPRARATITDEYIETQVAGQTILESINLIPGVNFTNSDAYGSSGGAINMRGFDGNRILLTFDGVPLNDTGNYTRGAPGEREAVFRSANSQLAFCDLTNRSYGVLRFTREACEAEWVAIPDVRVAEAPAPLVSRISASAGTRSGPGAWTT